MFGPRSKPPAYFGPEPGVYPSADWPASYGPAGLGPTYGPAPTPYAGPAPVAPVAPAGAPPGSIYDWTRDTLWVPDALAATALDGHDGKYNLNYYGTKIKIMKKKNGQLIYPGKPGDYGYGLQHPGVYKSDIYTRAGAQPGAPVYDPYKDVIYAPDAVTATALDLQDGGVNRKYHDTKIKIKKGKAPGYNPYYPMAAKQPIVPGYPVPGTRGYTAGSGYGVPTPLAGPSAYGGYNYGTYAGGAAAGYGYNYYDDYAAGSYSRYTPGLANPYGAGAYSGYYADSVRPLGYSSAPTYTRAQGAGLSGYDAGYASSYVRVNPGYSTTLGSYDIGTSYPNAATYTRLSRGYSSAVLPAAATYTSISPGYADLGTVYPSAATYTRVNPGYSSVAGVGCGC